MHTDASAAANTTSSPSEAVAENPHIRILTEKELRGVIARGDAAISRGDVVSGRRFYEYAAEAGSGPAALRLGETFDPAFLGLVGLPRVCGDALEAAKWYERARRLGAGEADILLRALLGDDHQPRQAPN